MAQLENQYYRQEIITYYSEVNGKLLKIDNVPARISLETGERFFTPDTVEKLQQIIWHSHSNPPTKVIETLVYDFGER